MSNNRIHAGHGVVCHRCHGSLRWHKNVSAAIIVALLAGVGLITTGGSVASAQAPDVWQQVGGDIDGESISDGSGFSVASSADANIVVVGTPSNDDNGTVSGHARVFGFDGVGWVQLGADIDGEASFDASGWSVALSADGNTVIIGSPGNDSNGDASGQARVFRYDGTAWVQQGANIDGEAPSDLSGRSVAMSADGNTVIIGAPGNGVNGTDSGQARVFRFDGTGWVQQGADINGEAPGDRSGESAAISADGNTVIIGSPISDSNGDRSGQARVFRFDGTGWVQQGADIDGEAPGDRSGESAAMSADGNTVIIGAPGNGGNGPFSGQARVFGFDGTGWVQQGADIDGEAQDDRSGESAAMSADGNTVIIGAPGNGGNGSSSGHARVFAFNGTGWVQQGADIDGEALLDGSGFSVAMSADGNRVMIGAPGNDGNDRSSGHTRVFSTLVQCAGFLPTIDMNTNGGVGIGTAGNDVILGTSSDDLIDGRGGDDVICGRGGDDNIAGGGGNDTIRGGEGNDTISGGEGNDMVVGGGGSDTIRGGGGADTLNGQRGDDTISGGGGNDEARGGPGRDSIFGGPGKDNLHGGDGNDTINGGAGDDTIRGEDGDDIINGQGGDDTINGGPGEDVLRGEDGNDFLNGRGDGDALDGGIGDDVISGGDGDDDVRGGPGSDRITGADGNDNISGGDGNDNISGGDGNDVIHGNESEDTIYGGYGDDNVDGGAGNDNVSGGDGNDSLRGGSGADSLNGGVGSDICNGGVDIDTATTCEAVTHVP